MDEVKKKLRQEKIMPGIKSKNNKWKVLFLEAEKTTDISTKTLTKR